MISVAEIRQAERAAMHAVAYFDSHRRQIETAASWGDLAMVAAGVADVALSPAFVTPANPAMHAIAAGYSRALLESRLHDLHNALGRSTDAMGDAAFDLLTEIHRARAVLDAARPVLPPRFYMRLNRLLDHVCEARGVVSDAYCDAGRAFNRIGEILDELRKAN